MHLSSFALPSVSVDSTVLPHTNLVAQLTPNTLENGIDYFVILLTRELPLEAGEVVLVMPGLQQYIVNVGRHGVPYPPYQYTPASE